jgi:hypothetical protein
VYVIFFDFHLVSLLRLKGISSTAAAGELPYANIESSVSEAAYMTGWAHYLIRKDYTLNTRKKQGLSEMLTLSLLPPMPLYLQ